MHYKRFGEDTFNRVFKIENVDVCKLITDAGCFPFIGDRIRTFNLTVHGMIHKCPFKQFHIENYTLSSKVVQGKAIKSTLLPNGFVRGAVVMRIRNKFIAFMEWNYIQNFL